MAPTNARTTHRHRGLFGDRNADTTTTGTRRGGFFSRNLAPDNHAAGLRGSLANPDTTHAGRQEAKAELREMGQSAHVPLSVKVSRALPYGELILTFSLDQAHIGHPIYASSPTRHPPSRALSLRE